MDSSFLSSLAQRIRDTREDADQKQKETAVALGTNLRTYRRYEYGESEPQVQFIADFCRHFGVSADYLLGLSDAKPEAATLSARFQRSPLDDLDPETLEKVYSYANFLRTEANQTKRRGA